jgi:hypothetical protein
MDEFFPPVGTADRAGVDVNIRPVQAHDFAHPQPGEEPDGMKWHDSGVRGFKEFASLFHGQNADFLLHGLRLETAPLHGVAVAEGERDPVVEKGGKDDAVVDDIAGAGLLGPVAEPIRDFLGEDCGHAACAEVPRKP